MAHEFTDSFEVTGYGNGAVQGGGTTAGTVTPGSAATASFVLKNTTNAGGAIAGIKGTFSLVEDPTIFSPDPAQPVLPTRGYQITLPGSSKVHATEVHATDKKGANKILDVLIEPGDSVTIGVEYEGPDAMLGQNVVTTLTANFTAHNANKSAATQMAYAVDTVQPAPKVGVQATTVEQLVTPGMEFTEHFRLVNESGQKAHIELSSIEFKVGDGQFDDGTSSITGVALNDEDLKVTLQSPFATLRDAISNLSPLPKNGSLTIEFSHIAPSAEENAILTSKVCAYAVVGPVTTTPSTSPTCGTAKSRMTGHGKWLAHLAHELDREYKDVKKFKSRAVLDSLKHADKKVAGFVNGTVKEKPTPNEFAHALAVHDLVDNLYDDLLERAEPPEELDIEP